MLDMTRDQLIETLKKVETHLTIPAEELADKLLAIENISIEDLKRFFKNPPQ